MMRRRMIMMVKIMMMVMMIMILMKIMRMMKMMIIMMIPPKASPIDLVRLLELDICDIRRIPRPIPNCTESPSADLNSAPVGRLPLVTAVSLALVSIVVLGDGSTDVSSLIGLVTTSSTGVASSAGFSSVFLDSEVLLSAGVNAGVAFALLALFRSCLARRRATHSGKYKRRISHLGFTSGTSASGLLFDSHD